METQQFDQDITVYCVAASSFPDGIMAAHKTVHDIFPMDGQRRFFGLSKPLDGHIRYEAAAEVLPQDDPTTYAFTQRTLPAGRYNTIFIPHFMQDISRIQRSFETLTSAPNIDPEAWCIEWYQGKDDMLCMLRLRD